MVFRFNGNLYTINLDGLLFSIIILSLFLLLVLIISLMRIYKKAGKPAISAIVPIWNIIVWLQIIEKPVWYIILMFIPIANIYVMFVMYIELAKKFGKGTAFGVLSVFFSWIMIPLLSFSSYQGENKKEDEETVNNTINEAQATPVMPIAPSNNASVEGEKIVNEENKEIGETNLTSEAVSPEKEEISPVGDVPVGPEMTIDNQPILGGETPVVEEPKVIEESENTPVIPEVNENNGVLPEQPVVPEPVNINTVDDNSENIQDIEKKLYTNKPAEAKDIAFGKAPIINEDMKVQDEGKEISENNGNVQPLETIESLSTNLEPNLETITENNEEVPITNVNNVETTSSENTQGEDNIELPEKATKTCPACGVSLAEDTKFCIACGTQL